MSSTLVLPFGEVTAGHTLGDKHLFDFKPIALAKGGLANRGVVSAKAVGIDTNLIVFTQSGRIYTFYLWVESVRSKNLPDLKGVY